MKRKRAMFGWRLVLHWFILINFLSNVVYAAYMVFFVLSDVPGLPLFNRAAGYPFDMLMFRRLYAIEFWISFSGMVIYVAITELVPHLREIHGKDFVLGIIEDQKDNDDNTDEEDPHD